MICASVPAPPFLASDLSAYFRSQTMMTFLISLSDTIFSMKAFCFVALFQIPFVKQGIDTGFT